MKHKIVKLILILTTILILIDQISKFAVQAQNERTSQNRFIEITVIKNTGMAFGMNEGNTKNIILTFLILVIIANFIRNQKDRIDRKTAIAMSLILAGGISNLIDRIVKKGVIDFIKIKNFAIFNVADCYIVIGWILLIVFLIKFNKEIVGEKNCEKQ